MSGPQDHIDVDAALAAADAALRRAGLEPGCGPDFRPEGQEDSLPTGAAISAEVQEGAEQTAHLLRPRLRLFMENLWIDRGERGCEDFHEVRVAVLSMEFEYEGFCVHSSDPRAQVDCRVGGRACVLARDLAQERQAGYTLESFGAIQIDLLEDYGTAPGSQAEYLIDLRDDAHALCAFTAYALPQLQALGFHVQIDPSYPYQVLDTDPPWYAVIGDPDGGEWFDLELGVEVDGHRVNLLPTLLAMLDQGAGQLELGRIHERAPRFVPIPDGTRHLPVPPDQFATLARVLSELYQGEASDSPRFPAARTVFFGELEGALGQGSRPFSVTAPERVGTRMRALSAPAATLPPGHGGLRATLRPYQEEGVRFLQRLRAQELGGVLADDMGLGKTLQTIAHLCIEVSSGRAHQPSLIVAPTSLVGNWRRELSRFAPHLRVCVLHGPQRGRRRAEAGASDVIVTTYPVLMRDREYFESLPYHLLVLDEAQTVKNPKSHSHRAVKALDAAYRVCLTGTPIENSLDELWSLFDFLMPDLLGSEMQFRHFFRHPIEQHADEQRLELLREAVGPFILRRMKDEVARELPRKTEVVRPVELHGKQRELYESIRVAAHAQVRSAIQKRGFSASTVTILDALMKLRQLCCDPRLVRGDAARFVRESAKYELLFRLLPSQLAEGRRVLLFSQFTSMLSLIAEGLTERGMGYALLTGSTQQRERPIAAFERGDVDVFLISLKAGGTGLNLVSADTVIHYDPWWNPAAQDQATDRAYRIGQTRPVFVYNLIAAGSVEERMLALQERKRRLAAGVIGAREAGPGRLDEAELEHLLSPLE